jgi:beta-glucanase (GH16 family)
MIHNGRKYWVICLIFCVCTSFSQNLPVKQKEPESNKGKMVFIDDFSNTYLDRSKWTVEKTGMHVNDELQAYVDSDRTIYIENGMLVLQPRFDSGFITPDGQKFDFISGKITTKNKFDFKYGTAEARIKLTEGSGLWPAWWLLGYGNWPETGEIDIMENIGELDWASAAIHGSGYSGETPFVNRYYFEKNKDIQQWHIYGVDWTPDSLVFKYDGLPMFRVTRTMTANYGKWSFENNKFLILNFALGGAYPVKINGFKKTYYGLDPKTIQLIKNNNAKMFVDWVKVFQR